MAVIEALQSDRRPNSSILLVIAGLLLAASLYLVSTSTMSQVAEQEASGGRGKVAEARLGKGTEGLVKQTALHMSKLLGGDSIGGFPGFEPPDDDETYRGKIRNQTYTGEEANHWIKEINSFLQQIVKKNPNMTLEEILQQAGLNASETQRFMSDLRDIHVIAKIHQESGVNPQTVEVLEELMEILGVAPWPL